PQQAQVARVADQEDQVKVRVSEDLVGDVVPVGAADKGDGRAEAHLQSLRRRFLILYHFDVPDHNAPSRPWQATTWTPTKATDHTPQDQLFATVTVVEDAREGAHTAN